MTETSLPAATCSLRVMTYNVHGCAGTDGRYDVARIASVISEYVPDVVALQELDVERPRSGGGHQANQLAKLLGMEGHFHPAWLIRAEEQYGDAILTRWPFRLRKAENLPTARSPLAFEPRGALWVTVEKNGVPIHFLNTHLGLSWKERRAQAEALASEAWLAHPDCSGPCVLCGDLNDIPGSRVYRILSGRLRDAQRCLSETRAKPTFPSRFPLMRLDSVFISAGIEVEDTLVPRTSLTKVASDHLPLIVDLKVSVSLSELRTEEAAKEALDLVTKRSAAPQVHGDVL